jgi:hypothetical protein
MYVSKLIGNVSGWWGQDVVENPSWKNIEAAINALDGKHRSVVSIGGEGEAHMSIGGGDCGQYVVYATFDNANFFTLLSLDQSEGKLLLFVAGQEGNYEKKIVVDLQSAPPTATKGQPTWMGSSPHRRRDRCPGGLRHGRGPYTAKSLGNVVCNACAELSFPGYSPHGAAACCRCCPRRGRCDRR